MSKRHSSLRFWVQNCNTHHFVPFLYRVRSNLRTIDHSLSNLLRYWFLFYCKILFEMYRENVIVYKKKNAAAASKMFLRPSFGYLFFCISSRTKNRQTDGQPKKNFWQASEPKTKRKNKINKTNRPSEWLLLLFYIESADCHSRNTLTMSNRFFDWVAPAKQTAD